MKSDDKGPARKSFGSSNSDSVWNISSTFEKINFLQANIFRILTKLTYKIWNRYGGDFRTKIMMVLKTETRNGVRCEKGWDDDQTTTNLCK